MTLVFLHLERTGGTTLYHLLAGVYSAEMIRPVPFGRVLRDLPQKFPSANYGDTVEYHRDFVYGGCEVVMGHYDWSIVGRVRNPEVLFLMREPVARVISLYKLFQKPERQKWCTVSQRVSRMTLDEFIDDESLRPLTSEAGTRILLGRRWSCPDMDPISDADLALAVERVESAAYVGITRRFGRFVRLLAAEIERDFETVPVVNAGELAIEPTPGQRRRILAYNQADAILFQYATERFEHDCEMWHIERC